MPPLSLLCRCCRHAIAAPPLPPMRAAAPISTRQPRQRRRLLTPLAFIQLRLAITLIFAAMPPPMPLLLRRFFFVAAFHATPPLLLIRHDQLSMLAFSAMPAILIAAFTCCVAIDLRHDSWLSCRRCQADTLAAFAASFSLADAAFTPYAIIISCRHAHLPLPPFRRRFAPLMTIR